jgi:hypothetical protein
MGRISFLTAVCLPLFLIDAVADALHVSGVYKYVVTLIFSFSLMALAIYVDRRLYGNGHLGRRTHKRAAQSD